MSAFMLWFIYVVGMIIITLLTNRENAILWVLMWILFELVKISEKIQ